MKFNNNNGSNEPKTNTPKTNIFDFFNLYSLHSIEVKRKGSTVNAVANFQKWTYSEGVNQPLVLGGKPFLETYYLNLVTKEFTGGDQNAYVNWLNSSMYAFLDSYFVALYLHNKREAIKEATDKNAAKDGFIQKVRETYLPIFNEVKSEVDFDETNVESVVNAQIQIITSTIDKYFGRIDGVTKADFPLYMLIQERIRSKKNADTGEYEQVLKEDGTFVVDKVLVQPFQNKENGYSKYTMGLDCHKSPDIQFKVTQVVVDADNSEQIGNSTTDNEEDAASSDDLPF